MPATQGFANPVFCAMDRPDLPAAVALARSLVGIVGGVKIGLELFTANGPTAVREISALGLPVFLDLKLHDIPNTVAGAVRAIMPLEPAMLTLHAAGGRCAGLHYGTYDYSASLGIAAAQQSMDHPAADHAKAVMQVAAAGTGVPVCDGSTNVLPVGDTEQVHAAWHLHARLVRRSLERGFYQGWDLHPAQLPTRYAATYAFFRHGFAAAAARLDAYFARRVEGIADEPATARALAGYLLRGLHCGALDEDEVPFDRSTLEAQ